jgi:hypothetical protein
MIAAALSAIAGSPASEGSAQNPAYSPARYYFSHRPCASLPNNIAIFGVYIPRNHKEAVMPRLTLLLLLLVFTTTCFSQTPMDVQPVKELKPTGTLATCGYSPASKEDAFYGKLAPSERATGSFMKAYSIHHKKGKFVSWFGIVRGISQQQCSDKFSLLLEQKYFDGLTDCHIMLVSKNGSGDFIAHLQGSPAPIPALALVRVYGKVVDEKNDVPEITADYIRVWPWLTFTFTDLGAEDHSNPRWAAYCKLCKRNRIYDPYPTEQYYLEMLGDPKDFGPNWKDFK